MNVILDLDYTLLDTARFKQALASEFESCGIGESRFQQTYRQTISQNYPDYDYDPSRHADLLFAELECTKSQLMDRVEKLLSNTAEYLYPGALNFLQELRNMDFNLILLTLGNVEWQRMKIQKSDLETRFDQVIYVRKSKLSAMNKLSDLKQPVIVINDNSDEVMEMLQLEPDFLYIVKRGPKGVHKEMPVPVADNFEQIIELIKTSIGRL